MTKPTLRNLKHPNSLTVTAIAEAKGINNSKQQREKSYDRKMSLYVSDDVWKSLQLRKIDTGRNVNDIVNEAIIQYLGKGSGL